MKRNEQLKDQILNDPLFGTAVKFCLEKTGDLKNKVILDSGCGSGRMSVFFAIQGAKVIGVDKKKSMIDSSINLANRFNVQENCLFMHEHSESSSIDSQSIDIIFSESTIQYMDRDKVLDEYKRIVKADGIVVLIENLPYNPFINLYRLHRRVFSRTPRGKKYIKSIRGYITPNEIESFADYFRYSEHHEYHFLRVLSIYLKSHSRHNRILTKTDAFLSALDEKLFNIFPFMRHFAWFTALYCREKKECLQ